MMPAEVKKTFGGKYQALISSVVHVKRAAAVKGVKQITVPPTNLKGERETAND